MDNIDLYESQRYYRRGVDFTTRSVDRILDRFRESLGDWLHGALNWPESDWEADLAGFIEHTHYAGLNIASESQAMLRELLAVRASGTGVFAALADKPSVQLAAIGLGVQDTDAELNYSKEDPDEVEEETAGAGPATSPAFQEKVRLILQAVDPLIARVWQQHQGVVRSRKLGVLQFGSAYYFERQKNPLVIVVLSTLTAQDTAVAIIEAAYTNGTNPLNSIVVERKLLSAKQIEKEFQELREEAFRQAAREAAQIAELYYGAIGSLTPAGDLVVTIDDVNRNGFRLEHLLIALPMMTYLRKGIKRLVIKLANGKTLRIPAKLLEKLKALSRKRLKSLFSIAEKAKTEEESLAILERGISAFAKRGQVHHAISDKVYKALQNHQFLRNKYKHRDKRFELIAVREDTHVGYQAWHDAIDNEVVGWIRRNKKATEKQFEAMLRSRYGKDDLKWRFANDL